MGARPVGWAEGREPARVRQWRRRRRGRRVCRQQTGELLVRDGAVPVVALLRAAAEPFIATMSFLSAGASCAH
eukprot:3928541-Prymnesium_polylepis.1